MKDGVVEVLAVDDLMKSAHDPLEDPKLTVIRAQRSFEDEDCSWVTDQAIKRLKDLVPGMDISDLSLPSHTLSDDPDANDVGKAGFVAGDQFPLIVEPMLRSTFVLIASSEKTGFPHPSMVKLIHRLCWEKKRRSKESKSSLLFSGVPCGVVVHGGYGAHQAAMNLACAMNSLGCLVPARGLAFWDKHRGDVQKADVFASHLDVLAASLVDACQGR